MKKKQLVVGRLDDWKKSMRQRKQMKKMLTMSMIHLKSFSSCDYLASNYVLFYLFEICDELPWISMNLNTCQQVNPSRHIQPFHVLL